MRLLAWLLLVFWALAATTTAPRRLRVFAACGFHGREWATSQLCEEWARRSRLNTTRAEWSVVSEVNAQAIRAARVRGHACARKTLGGVDLNRNFPSIAERCEKPWKGARPGPDAEDYGGATPFSEPETRELARRMEQFAPIDLAFFVHTGTVGIISPFDECWAPPKEPLRSRQRRLAQELVEPLLKFSPRMRIGAGLSTMYPAVGTATDYAHAVLGVPFAYTLETYELPKHCAGDNAYLLRTPTANMTRHECELTFVPRYGPDCSSSDTAEYLRRWNLLFDVIERMLSEEKERRVLEKWLDVDLAA